jgi:glucose/arabinose dehydrogenase
MSKRLFRFGLPLALTGALVWFVMSALASSGVPSANGPAPAAKAQAVSASLPFTITLAPIVTTGLIEPVHVTHAGDGSGRLFVVERAGRIRIIKNGTLLSKPYLDISSLVQAGYIEQGLLSVAFDPDFQSNGTFYVDYTSLSGIGDTVIARYVVSDPSADVAGVVAAANILTITQPEVNHNGGQLQFDPKDGYLYIGAGDGGGAGDQHGSIGNAQDQSKLLGKLLRINVRGVLTYTIPPTNPFTQTLGARPEVWAYGLRNPWRFSFDRVTGDLYIGDVGQDCFEEVDYQPAASQGGENYGWRRMEGFHQFDPSQMTNCSQPMIAPPGLTLPITDYVHPVGEAVVGGYVYRGSQFPQMHGVYFYGDDVTGKLWAIWQVSPGHWTSSLVATTSLAISSFGEDEGGELYAVDLNGGVYKIVSAVILVNPYQMYLPLALRK